MTRGDKSTIILLTITLCLIVTPAFLPCLKNDFVNWDDDRYVYKNTDALNLSLGNLRRISTTFFEGHYFPLTLLSFAVEYHEFGLDPLPYHITNLLLHNLNCLLVFFFVFKISGSVSASFITSLLFGIHPFHAGVVAWITNRKELLMAFFFLSSTVSYLRYSELHVRKYYWLSLLLFILALLSKSMAVTLPLVLLLCDYARGSINVRSWKEKIPYFVISFVFGIVALLARGSAIHTAPEPPVSLDNIFGTTYTLIAYFLPRQILPIHPYLPAISRNSIVYWLSPLPVVGLITMIVFLRKCHKKITFGLAFFLITILPPLKLITIGPTADRYAYLPSIGIYFIIGEVFIFLTQRKFHNNRSAKIALWTLLISGFAVFYATTQERCKVWKNGITLYSDILAHSHHPFNIALSLINRAEAYTDKGLPEKALEDLNRALSILPDYGPAYLDRAKAYFELKKYDQARDDLHQAARLRVKVDPEFNNKLRKTISK